MRRMTPVIVLLASGWLVAGCGSAPDSSAKPAEASSKPAASQAPAADAKPAGDPAKPFNIGDVFPPGAGRDKVLDTCGSCHTVACSAQGQRTAERWDRIMEGHRDKLTSMSDADIKAVFGYLKANFNDTKPEPRIPAELLQQGCTPF
jgi:hypothetical protein